ncbi:(2,3-dihydroxybenzoyl)adenylate synthase [Micromonospora chersina]|uniref:(2,3-dihydroxybenzoyl)adenylate synthase n=1 Tax=Micromonospora chersina TaxID=47854 RepID=UPI0033D21426
MTVGAMSRAGTVPWPDEAAAEYVAKGYWEGRPLGAHLLDAADATPAAVCLVDRDTRFTYEELVSRVDGAAWRMRELGLRGGDRVVMQLPNSWEFVVVLLACFRLGAVPVMALAAHRRQEIASMATRTDAKAIFVADTVKGFDHQEMAHEIAREVPSVEYVLVTGGTIRKGSVDLRRLCRPAEDGPGVRRRLDADAPDGTDVALFLLSGGTTGVAKLIARTHNDYAYMIRQSASICGVGPDTVCLAVLPLAHGYPMAGPGILGVLLSGGRVVLAPSPAPERAFVLIEQERVTMTSLVPAAVQRWMEYRVAEPDFDLSSLQFVQAAGSRLADHVAAQVTPVLGCALQQVYGMAEGLLCLTRLDDPQEAVCRTQGRPICPDDELRLVDDDGRIVTDGSPGILLTRGPYTPRGYFRAEELNAQAFVDGWYRTGDIVRIRPDGNLVIEGRNKDLINRGGEKISAEEVENYAYQARGVRLAAAVAMPDAELGERICLYVVPEPGAVVSLAEIRGLMEHAGVARFKLPERLVLVGSLPSTNVGKIDKKALRKDIAERMRDGRADA